MVRWALSRISDLLLALLLAALVLWFLLTQPVFPRSADALLLPLQPETLEADLKHLMSIHDNDPDDQVRLKAILDYLYLALSGTGVVDIVERGNGQKLLNVKVGKDSSRKLFVVFHYVVTEKPMLEAAELASSLIALCRSLMAEDGAEMQLNLSIFIHPYQGLSAGLLNASLYHAESIQARFGEGDWLLVFAPGFRLPDALYASEQWKYFSLLQPRSSDELALFGRMADTLRLRQLKVALGKAGIRDTESLNIPTSFGDISESALKIYWDRQLPAILTRPDILVHDKNFDGHIRFVSALYLLLDKGI
ncbi:MAG: hypothetical protein KDI15_11255 [Thiothrix sp.]|nr:hypothetical protein [Thiothrix sp.]HPE59719.1 hypothetical protein [Thiolinea sp.]